jgi:hypothetical protein
MIPRPSETSPITTAPAPSPKRVPTMDQLAACSGFMYSMITAKQYVQSGDYKNILVV